MTTLDAESDVLETGATRKELYTELSALEKQPLDVKVTSQRTPMA